MSKESKTITSHQTHTGVVIVIALTTFVVKLYKLQHNWDDCSSLTSMRPVVVWPEMSSPAQSLASVTQPTSASSAAPPPSVLLLVSVASVATSATFFWQNIQDRMRQDRTSSSPVKNVIRLEQRNAYQCRSLRHSASDISASSSAIGRTVTSAVDKPAQ